MKKTFYIATLKILKFIREPGLFAIMLLLPLVFTFFMGNMNTNSVKIPVAFIDLDQSTYSENLIAQLQQNTNYEILKANQEDTSEMVKQRKVVGAFILEEGLEASVRSGKTPKIQVQQVYETPELLTLMNDIRTALTYIHANINIADSTLDFIQQHKAQPIESQIIWEHAYENAISKWFPKPPVSVTMTELGSTTTVKSQMITHSSVGFTLFFVMYTIIFAVGDILAEKQQGTWQRLLVFPVKKREILGGNLLASFVLGFIQILLLMLFGIFLFNVDWGNDLPYTLLLIGAYVFAISCMGLALSGIVKTPAQLHTATPIITVCTAMLGGTFWPLDFVQSKVLLLLAKLTPQYWAIHSIESVIHYGGSFRTIQTPFLMLLFMGFVFFFAGLRLVKWE